mmetsp:Transcript_14911/g.42836  ORF Transcript_14911/g.42836 Transcript_14911/m.42836 type:complete len:206 (+) Transcript_14911:777-1394(+)
MHLPWSLLGPVAAGHGVVFRACKVLVESRARLRGGGLAWPVRGLLGRVQGGVHAQVVGGVRHELLPRGELGVGGLGEPGLAEDLRGELLALQVLRGHAVALDLIAAAAPLVPGVVPLEARGGGPELLGDAVVVLARRPDHGLLLPVVHHDLPAHPRSVCLHNLLRPAPAEGQHRVVPGVLRALHVVGAGHVQLRLAATVHRAQRV